MQRDKNDKTENYAGLLSYIASLKSYSSDLIYDAKKIYEIQLEKYKEWLSENDIQDLKKSIDTFSSIKVTLVNSNRIYVVASISFFQLVVYNMDESIIDKLQYTYELISCNDDKNLDYVVPSYRSTLFLFKDNNLVLSSELSSRQLSTLMAVFHKENMVSYKQNRYELCGKPIRRSNKKNTNK